MQLNSISSYSATSSPKPSGPFVERLGSATNCQASTHTLPSLPTDVGLTLTTRYLTTWAWRFGDGMIRL